jgi:predicted GNAT family acetyltransferase
MAAVTNLVLRDHDVVCLYVNDFNAPAIATYLHCGYEVVGQNSTVLY